MVSSANQGRGHPHPSASLCDGVVSGTAASKLLEDIDVRSLSPLGSGTDHDAFGINDEFVLRCAIDTNTGTAERIRRETALLALVAQRSPIPVPEVVASDPEAGLVLLTMLPGRPLLDVDRPDRGRLVAQLGPFLQALHSTPPKVADRVAMSDDTTHDEYLDGVTEDLEAVARHVDRQLRAPIEEFLAEPPPPAMPPECATLCHNDLGAEHLIVSEPSHLSGVIDWSDAAITDPARDYGKLARDLGFDAIAPLVADCNDDGLLGRALFHARCSLIEDLRFGFESGDDRYSDAAFMQLAKLF